jgi:hypothetical protein
VEIAAIAQKVLEGVVAISRNERAKGFAALEEAVKLEDKLIYTEPKDWPLPARQFLGATCSNRANLHLQKKSIARTLSSTPPTAGHW